MPDEGALQTHNGDRLKEFGAVQVILRFFLFVKGKITCEMLYCV